MSIKFGDRMSYSLGGDKAVVGVLIGIRRTGTTIYDPSTKQEWPGIQFQLRTDDGRTLWTITYPDRGDVE